MADTKVLLKHIGIVLGVFVIVGVGIGATGSVMINTMGKGSVMMGVFVLLQALMFANLIGPVVAAVSGLLSGVSLRSPTNAAVAGGVGGFVGFYVMALFAVLIVWFTLPSGGGAGAGAGAGDGAGTATSLGKQIKPILLAGLPTCVVGVLAGPLGTRFVS